MQPLQSILITGGAGFIGTNLASHYLQQDRRVTLFDNLSRPGVDANVAWLRSRFGQRFSLEQADVRTDSARLAQLAEEVDAIFHLAAQVAVTTSVRDPRLDFETNAQGTLNVLEAVRKSNRQPVVLYSSTNKVYGCLANIDVREEATRYAYVDHPRGIPETQPLDFYSPYGCSKGAGDQYVLDYSRIYGLKTVVFRQSCIYGTHQRGLEDQGWLAWFAIRALERQPVTLYGDGKQVRDVLQIDDLVAAYDGAVTQIERTNGQAYNIGGGPEHTLSLLELIDILARELGERPKYEFGDWRPGDQRVFVSRIDKAGRDFNWTPRVGVREGVSRLVDWLRSQGYGDRSAGRTGSLEAATR